MCRCLSFVMLTVTCLFGTFAYADKALPLQVSSHSTQFDVVLDENRTTGYQWKIVQFDHKQFKLKSQQYIAPQTRLIGAGGKKVFTFVVLKQTKHPTQSVMTFQYVRPWDPSSATVKNITVQFK